MSKENDPLYILNPKTNHYVFISFIITYILVRIYQN